MVEVILYFKMALQPKFRKKNPPTKHIQYTFLFIVRSYGTVHSSAISNLTTTVL